MKKYLIMQAWASMGDAVKGMSKEHDSLETAILAFEEAANSTFIRGSGGTHRAGWKFFTLHRTTSGVGLSGLLPSNYDPTLVATFYEIELSNGQTASQVYDDWHAEQERIRQEEVSMAIDGSVQDFKKTPHIMQGALKYDGEYDTGYQWKLGDDFLNDSLEILLYVMATGEQVDFGRVRITIESLEVESDQE